MREIETVETETGPDVVGSVIWLHGLGADGHDFEPIVPELKLPASLPLRFVFPHAPVRPVTINGGMAMRAWFDILSLDRSGRADPVSLAESGRILTQLVERERRRGIPDGRIVLAGFSQGGAVVLDTVMREPLAVAGIMVLSTFLPRADAADAGPAAVAGTPAFVAHGTQDPMLPLALGRECAERVERLGYRVEWHDYPMGHGVCPPEIDDISAWLAGVYAGAEATSNE